MLTPSSEISVVLQGPVHRTPDVRAGLNLTDHCVKSVRHALPDAEIIVSTWEKDDASGLECDKVVKSVDPGPTDYPIAFAQNCNRQMVSTLAGLRASTRPFAVKMRSDTILEFPAFLEYQYRFPKRGLGKCLFTDKVIVSGQGTANMRQARLLFSLSDFFYFGRTTDLLTLFDAPLMSRPPGEPPLSGPFISEQYLMVQAMRKAGIDVTPNGPWPGNYRKYLRKYAIPWERFLFANFVMAHPSHLGLMLTRRLYVHQVGYSWIEFDRLYELYCNNPRTFPPLPRRDMVDLLGCYLRPPR